MTPELTTLENGLRIVTLALARVETVAAGLYVGVGARFEDEMPGGISHFLEHMVFKGTARRSARAIAEEIEDVGASINAYTARDVTAYYVRMLKDDLPLGIDILSDLTRHARLDPAEVMRERDVILREIGQVQDTPDDLIFDVLQEAAYPDQAFGAPILGTPGSVSSIDEAVLKAFCEQHYCGRNMVLAAAGNLDHDRVVDLAASTLGSLAPGAVPAPKTALWSGEARHHTRPAEQAHIALGYSGVGLEDERLYALQVLSTILGGGMSSILFQTLREERGLAYTVFSDVTAHADAGFLTLYAGTSTAARENAEGLMRECVDTLKTFDDGPALARAKAQLKAGLAMSLESTSALSEQIGRQILSFGRFIPPQELISKVDAVTIQDVKAMADHLLERRTATAVIAPQA